MSVAAPAPVPKSGVTVRMYRTGFGDCFLLIFRGAKGQPVYMLIDCGAHNHHPARARIQQVVAEIREATGGHLHVLAVTHEHADHINGFSAARSIFEHEIRIEDVWLAWTEEPGNAAAKAIKNKQALMLQGLRAAARSLAARNSPLAGRFDGLLSFFDFGMHPARGSRPARPVTGSETMDIIRALGRDRKYLKPKQPPLAIPGVEGVRIFVLGPPEDRASLLHAKPAGRAGEVYQELGDYLDPFAAALLAANPANYIEDSRRAALGQPFAANHRIPVDVAKEQDELYKIYHDHYGFDDTHKQSWRRIDYDWQDSAEYLALKLDTATNNTSLVLAIELPHTKRVLLFPGDAQVGNWKSWHDSDWTEENGLAQGERISAKDLLRRTVLYKVGHHGSHNATLRELGLEMMVSDELAAIIPVDQEWAESRKPHSWKMPFGPLYQELERRTHGRILRMDSDAVAEAAVWRPFPQPYVSDSYLELTIPDK